MGAIARMAQQPHPRPRPEILPALLQPPSTPHLTRRPATHQPRSARLKAGQLGPDRALDARAHGLDDLHARPPLRVALDEVPRRRLGAGALDHVLDRRCVLLALLAVAPVLVG